jgi:hypothetical protein
VWIASGLAAVAATDSREIPPGLSAVILVLLFHAGRRVSPNGISSHFRDAAGLADPILKLSIVGTAIGNRELFEETENESLR